MSRYPDGTTPPEQGWGYRPGDPWGNEAAGEPAAGEQAAGQQAAGEEPTSSWSSPAPDSSHTYRDPKKNALIILLIIGAVAITIIAVSIAVSGLGAGFEPTRAEDLNKPPSQRNQHGASDDPLGGGSSGGQVPGGVDKGVEEPGAAVAGSDPAGTDGDDFRDVRCTFSGASTLRPGISDLTFQSGSRQEMELKDGASFNCIDEFGTSSGKVSMTASFPRLSAVAGSGSGPGLIEWETIPPDAPGADGATRESKTENEVELVLPNIVVWITIIDGPYAGMKGKLTLVDWELIQQIDGTIVGVRFHPTDFTLAVP